MGKRVGSIHASETLAAWARIVGKHNGNSRRSTDRSVVAPTGTHRRCSAVIPLDPKPFKHQCEGFHGHPFDHHIAVGVGAVWWEYE